MRFASTLLFVVLVASLASHGSPQEREKCMINFLEGCRLHPWYAGRGELADDSLPAYNHLGVGASEERCLALYFCRTGVSSLVRYLISFSISPSGLCLAMECLIPKEYQENTIHV